MCHQELWIGRQWILVLPEEQNEEEEDGRRWSCCAVRHCHMLFHHTHILCSPADVFGGRDESDDTS